MVAENKVHVGLWVQGSERLKRHTVLGCSGVKCTAEFKGTRGQSVKVKTLGGESILGARCQGKKVIKGMREN